MRDEAFQAHVGRQPPSQGFGVGPARGGDDEHVVARQGAGGHQQEPAQVRVVQRALGDVDDGAAVPSSGHQDGSSKDGAGGARIGPTKRTVGARSERGYSKPATVSCRKASITLG